jgi:hypothetical protein
MNVLEDQWRKGESRGFNGLDKQDRRLPSVTAKEINLGW